MSRPATQPKRAQHTAAIRAAVRAAVGDAPRFSQRATYYMHLKSRLTPALSPQWQGTRQRLRQHLRATATPAMASALLLTFSAAPAQADTVCDISFTELTGAANPLDSLSVLAIANPEPVDLDVLAGIIPVSDAGNDANQVGRFVTVNDNAPNEGEGDGDGSGEGDGDTEGEGSVEDTICSSPWIRIPSGDPSGVSDDIVIPPTSGDDTIVDVNVSLSIDHPIVGELSATLEHVDTGGIVTLFNMPTRGTDPCDTVNLGVTLDDEGSGGDIQTDCPGYPQSQPSYRPLGPLFMFDGLPRTGTWRLTVTDSQPGNTGDLVAWCLTILTADSEVEGEGQAPPLHNADQNGDQVFDLGELLRVIQFYNAGGYSCFVAEGAGEGKSDDEDGFVAGTGDETCLPHSSDYVMQDWSIELSELLRLIQLYNIGGYNYCRGIGEDDFCGD